LGLAKSSGLIAMWLKPELNLIINHYLKIVAIDACS